MELTIFLIIWFSGEYFCNSIEKCSSVIPYSGKYTIQLFYFASSLIIFLSNCNCWTEHKQLLLELNKTDLCYFKIIWLVFFPFKTQIPFTYMLPLWWLRAVFFLISGNGWHWPSLIYMISLYVLAYYVIEKTLHGLAQFCTVFVL